MEQNESGFVVTDASKEITGTSFAMEGSIFGITDSTQYVPMMFQGTPGELAAMFEGGVIPKVGDYIGADWICYDISEAQGQVSVKCRWRVRLGAKG